MEGKVRMSGPLHRLYKPQSTCMDAPLRYGDESLPTHVRLVQYQHIVTLFYAKKG